MNFVPKNCTLHYVIFLRITPSSYLFREGFHSAARCSVDDRSGKRHVITYWKYVLDNRQQRYS
jgi:hypothetical protein